MNSTSWILQNRDGCTYFEFIDGPYSMKFTVGAVQERCLIKFSPTFLKQIHSATIITIDEDAPCVGDGLLTHNPQQVLGIRIADCLPVYLYNEETMCIIHCGWRGILKGIARKARDLMGAYSFALGACIGPECYEVKHDVAGRFGAQYPDAVFEQNGKYSLDLKKAVIQDLNRTRLTADLALCTKCHPEYFFSYRRGDREKRNYALISRR